MKASLLLQLIDNYNRDKGFFRHLFWDAPQIYLLNSYLETITKTAKADKDISIHELEMYAHLKRMSLDLSPAYLSCGRESTKVFNAWLEHDKPGSTGSSTDRKKPTENIARHGVVTSRLRTYDASPSARIKLPNTAGSPDSVLPLAASSLEPALALPFSRSLSTRSPRGKTPLINPKAPS